MVYIYLQPKDIKGVINSFEFDKIKDNKKVWYYNVPVSFDIEVSSFKSIHMDKKCCMYMWSFAIYDKVIIGRTWEEFIKMCYELSEELMLDENNRLVIYVHNLSYEFQFIRKWFEWKSVFSLEKRKPIKALTTNGIEFRCSYLLSGYGLEKLSEQLIHHNVKKLVGNLDYNKIRTSETLLTKEEYDYSANDVLIVTAYIEELIEQYGSIINLPLTKTGFVRKFMRNKCLYTDSAHKNVDEYKKYRKLMRSLTLTPQIYIRLKQAFAGGFTHANPAYSGETLNSVKSFDETSAYPATMVSKKFPMSTFEPYEMTMAEEFYDALQRYCCLMTVHMYGLKPKVLFENYISKSHCLTCKNPVENNGRIVSADEISMTITEQDFIIIMNMYEWDDLVIDEMYVAQKAYLPKPIIEGVLELYGKKTTLKEVKGKEAEYMRSKEDINSTFGMCVTDICRDEIIYSSEWSSEKPDLEEAIKLYNNSTKRFLYYAWGVWITAYARMNLFSGILEFKNDYVYSDTDSIKGLNYQKHMNYINKYNESIVKQIDTCLLSYGLNPELSRPKNKWGKVKQLGVWNEEDLYTRFKTLGAKRYMTETGDGITMTVSGVNKKKAIPYLLKKYGCKNIFKEFNDGLSIPSTYMDEGVEKSATGKLTHTYIDDEIVGKVKDYQGKVSTYHEKSGIHMEGADYSLSLSDLYVDYLFGIRNDLIATA